MGDISLDIQEINLDNPGSEPSKEVSMDNDFSSVLGDGIGLLMNDKVKNAKKSSSSNSLKGLEDELKMIEETNNTLPLDEKNTSSSKSVDFNEKESFKNKPTIEIAKATVSLDKNSETWDGFKDINEINIEDIEKKTKKKTNEELLKEKFEILRKLETLESKGATLSKKYNMNSDLEEMKGEYEYLINEKEKSNSVKFQGKVLTTLITGLEFLNNKFDPFDIKLDGWSEQINESIDDFDEIFSELHQKYRSKAKMAPEIKLLFQLASSGIMIHMTNTMFKSALPGMDDIMRQNPDLMNHFTKAAMSSMENSTPGLSNFMNDFGMSHSKETNEIHSRPSSFEPTTPMERSRPFQQTQTKPEMRNEMKGPNNIDSLLSNLNTTKTTNITLDKDSTISIEDIENLNASSQSNKRKSKRKSDKNTISLAI
jgi:hypothetical protein